MLLKPTQDEKENLNRPVAKEIESIKLKTFQQRTI
jgi:hypothetical protein